MRSEIKLFSEPTKPLLKCEIQGVILKYQINRFKRTTPLAPILPSYNTGSIRDANDGKQVNSNLLNSWGRSADLIETSTSSGLTSENINLNENLRNVNNTCVDDTNESIANTLTIDHLSEVSTPCNHFSNTLIFLIIR